jgi:DNA-binding response OmpR family regulator
MKHLLLLEIDPVLGVTTRDALQRTDWQVDLCHDAQSALDVLDERLPDVILLELQLGLHNGIEFLYEIRSYPEWQQIPVVIYTLNPKAKDPQFTEAFAELGVRAIWYKPQVTHTQLIRALNNLFQPA